jgi:ectoine hydroxylase-related dioxygenase (phytanoyl-CoA dioxygenase family)
MTHTGQVCLTEAPDAIPVPVAAGSIVVFSSLTPHCTGPNRTGQVRKSYIVQYAPVGSEVLVGDSRADATRAPADAPERQFVVLADGRRVG